MDEIQQAGEPLRSMATRLANVHRVIEMSHPDEAAALAEVRVALERVTRLIYGAAGIKVSVLPGGG